MPKKLEKRNSNKIPQFVKDNMPKLEKRNSDKIPSH